jgi:hypothetical protein
MADGPSWRDMYRRAATYGDKILPPIRRGGRVPAARRLALPGLPGAESVLDVGVGGGRARRPEDVPARFTLYRSADNGPRG